MCINDLHGQVEVRLLLSRAGVLQGLQHTPVAAEQGLCVGCELAGWGVQAVRGKQTGSGRPPGWGMQAAGWGMASYHHPLKQERE